MISICIIVSLLFLSLAKGQEPGCPQRLSIQDNTTTSVHEYTFTKEIRNASIGNAEIAPLFNLVWNEEDNKRLQIFPSPTFKDYLDDTGIDSLQTDGSNSDTDGLRIDFIDSTMVSCLLLINIIDTNNQAPEFDNINSPLSFEIPADWNKAIALNWDIDRIISVKDKDHSLANANVVIESDNGIMLTSKTTYRGKEVTSPFAHNYDAQLFLEEIIPGEHTFTITPFDEVNRGTNATVVVKVNPVKNENPPRFKGTGFHHVFDNIPNVGESVGPPIEAFDPDDEENTNIKYSIQEPDSILSIDEDTGALEIIQNVTQFAGTTKEVIVTATEDLSGGGESTDVTVRLTFPKLELPKFSKPFYDTKKDDWPGDGDSLTEVTATVTDPKAKITYKAGPDFPDFLNLDKVTGAITFSKEVTDLGQYEENGVIIFTVVATADWGVAGAVSEPASTVIMAVFPLKDDSTTTTPPSESTADGSTATSCETTTTPTECPTTPCVCDSTTTPMECPSTPCNCDSTTTSMECPSTPCNCDSTTTPMECPSPTPCNCDSTSTPMECPSTPCNCDSTTTPLECPSTPCNCDSTVTTVGPSQSTPESCPPCTTELPSSSTCPPTEPPGGSTPCEPCNCDVSTTCPPGESSTLTPPICPSDPTCPPNPTCEPCGSETTSHSGSCPPCPTATTTEISCPTKCPECPVTSEIPCVSDPISSCPPCDTTPPFTACPPSSSTTSCPPCDETSSSSSDPNECESEDCSYTALIVAVIATSVLSAASICCGGYLLWLLRKATLDPMKMPRDSIIPRFGGDEAGLEKAPTRDGYQMFDNEPTESAGVVNPAFEIQNNEGDIPKQNEYDYVSPVNDDNANTKSLTFSQSPPLEAHPVETPVEPTPSTSETQSQPKKSNLKTPKEIAPDYEEAPQPPLETEEKEKKKERKISRVLFAPEDEYAVVDEGGAGDGEVEQANGSESGSEDERL